MRRALSRSREPRTAAFSLGVLEFLRRSEVTGPQDQKVGAVDQVGVIPGVSGPSFTALAYGLYGDRLFGGYEQRLLERYVQGDLTNRLTVWPPAGAAP